MERIETAPAQGGPETAGNASNNNRKPKAPTKLERVLTYLATGRSLHRFEAEREVNDHCLHSTMSEIKHSLGISYQVKYETVPGWRGHPTRVARYWLDAEAQVEAWKTVHAMRRKRGTEGSK